MVDSFHSTRLTRLSLAHQRAQSMRGGTRRSSWRPSAYSLRSPRERRTRGPARCWKRLRCLLAEGFVVLHDFPEDHLEEVVNEALAEFVVARLSGQAVQFFPFPHRVHAVEVFACLELAHFAGGLEAPRENPEDILVDGVDAFAQGQQFIRDGPGFHNREAVSGREVGAGDRRGSNDIGMGAFDQVRRGMTTSSIIAKSLPLAVLAASYTPSNRT